MITSAEDIVSELDWEAKEVKQDVIKELEDLNRDEQEVISAFRSSGEMDIDALGESVGMHPSNLSIHLFSLEMKGLISTLPGKRYRLA